MNEKVKDLNFVLLPERVRDPISRNESLSLKPLRGSVFVCSIVARRRYSCKDALRLVHGLECVKYLAILVWIETQT